MNQRRRSGLPLAVAVLVLAGISCGSDEGSSATTTNESTTSSSTTSASTTRESTTTDSATSSSSTNSTATTVATTTSTAPTSTTWRGQEVDLFARTGDVLGVVGVEHDDRLNIRSGPGTEHAIVALAAPGDSVVATGRAWRIPGAFWYEVESGAATGWANIGFLAYLGGVDDATSEIVAEFGEIPQADTMLELGLIAAQPFLTDEPPTRVVLSEAPTVGDLGEVTYDLLGFGDDSVAGLRLHVFGAPIEGGEGFSLGSVERTVLCGRGLSGENCV